MRAALRHLCQQGVEALKPQKVTTQAVQIGSYLIAKPSKQVWRKPVISKRVANVLRKQAIQQGTYGSFDATAGVGWDPSWDLVLYPNRYNVTRYSGMYPPKKTARERSREDRAAKIEEQLETRLEKIEEYYQEKEQGRVKDKSFEATYKRLTRGL